MKLRSGAPVAPAVCQAKQPPTAAKAARTFIAKGRVVIIDGAPEWCQPVACIALRYLWCVPATGQSLFQIASPGDGKAKPTQNGTARLEIDVDIHYYKTQRNSARHARNKTTGTTRITKPFPASNTASLKLVTP